MAKTYGVGVIGAGWVSTEHLRAYSKNPQTEVRWICGGSALFANPGMICEEQH